MTEKIRKASVRLTLDNGDTVYGTIRMATKTHEEIVDYTIEYFIDEVWKSNNRIVDVEVTSVCTNTYVKKRKPIVIKPGETLDDDQARYGHDWVPFMQYKVNESFNLVPVSN